MTVFKRYAAFVEERELELQMKVKHFHYLTERVALAIVQPHSEHQHSQFPALNRAERR